MTPHEHASNDFILEADLIVHFVRLLKDGLFPLKCAGCVLEFPHQAGRTDVIGVNNIGRVLAFEGKLTKWKDALQQARRNTAFAHYSYVLLPETKARVALKHKEQFRRFGVGLVTVGKSRSQVFIPAKWQKPLLPWLTASAKKAAKAQANHELCAPV